MLSRGGVAFRLVASVAGTIWAISLGLHHHTLTMIIVWLVTAPSVISLVNHWLATGWRFDPEQAGQRWAVYGEEEE